MGRKLGRKIAGIASGLKKRSEISTKAEKPPGTTSQPLGTMISMT